MKSKKLSAHKTDTKILDFFTVLDFTLREDNITYPMFLTRNLNLVGETAYGTAYTD